MGTGAGARGVGIVAALGCLGVLAACSSTVGEEDPGTLAGLVPRSEDAQSSVFGDSLGPYGGAGPLGRSGACVGVQVSAEAVPVSLVFMMDRSGSMGEGVGAAPSSGRGGSGQSAGAGATRWSLCGAGLASFLADPQSQGLRASLQFFPLSGQGAMCDAKAYAEPRVPLTDLPQSLAFASVLKSEEPNGGTPTLPAVLGALSYAETIRNGRGNDKPGKVAVVLVTDGEPNDCNSSVGAVAKVLAEKAATIPTFVIGVGNGENLQALAQAGGTGEPFVVELGSPERTSSQFQKALSTIRGRQLSCSYQIPTPPDGKKLNFAGVNVTLGRGNAREVLTYSADCSTPGWHYDNPKAPTRIELCSRVCDPTVGISAGSVAIELGCATRGLEPR